LVGLAFKASNEKEQGSQVIWTGGLVLISQSELPTFLKVQTGHFAHQRLTVPGHKAETSPGNKSQSLKLFTGNSPLTQVQHQTSELDLVHFLGGEKCITGELFGFDQSNACFPTQVDIVVHHEDRGAGRVGIGEQRATLVQQELFHEIGSRVRKKA